MRNYTAVLVLALLGLLTLGACDKGGETGDSSSTSGNSGGSGGKITGGDSDAAKEVGKLEGSVEIDGSSTVYPILEAAAEEFGTVQPKVRVTVGVSGTGGGFKRFCAGETAISNASRPISQKEIDLAATNKIEFIEIPMAYDGLSVVVNPKNDWCNDLTVAELHKIWAPGSTVNNWKDVRAGFPDRPLKLYGPGPDSGTFDYFTEAINGKAKESRSDYTASEDDNVIVAGVAGDTGAMGYFGFAYYEENQDQIRVVGIKVDDAAPTILPSHATIQDLTYQPLSRPLFFYVAKASTEKPEVVAFVDYFIANAAMLVDETGYISLPADVNGLVKEHWAARKTGSGFGGEGAKPGTKLEDILKSL